MSKLQRFLVVFLVPLVVLSVMPLLKANAQPIVDTVKSLQKANEKLYRQLGSMDDGGESYSFTNVIKWKITDGDLSTRLRDAIEKEPFNLKRDEFDVTDMYIFAVLSLFISLYVDIEKKKQRVQKRNQVLANSMRMMRL
jgi:predicted PurR-regulated permease PerM